MGLLFDYTDSDLVNHIRFIIRAYEDGDELVLDYPVRDVGNYFIIYKKPNYKGEITTYLEPQVGVNLPKERFVPASLWSPWYHWLAAEISISKSPVSIVTSH